MGRPLTIAKSRQRRFQLFGVSWFRRLLGLRSSSPLDHQEKQPRVSSSQTWRQRVKGRLVFAGVIFGVWAMGIEARLVFLQVMDHERLVNRAELQHLKSISVAPKRGEILDRQGRVLAYSVDGDAIVAAPVLIDDNDAVNVTTKLCGALDCSEKKRVELQATLSGSGQFAYVQRQASPDLVRRVAALDLPGIRFIPETRRYYPNRELAAHVLGYVGVDNQGLGGIESTYDKEIKGQPGRIQFQVDGGQRDFSRREQPPTVGATLELTIDMHLQHIAERELARTVREHQADTGTVVMLDPATGEVLALANWPTFNPNRFSEYKATARRNRAIQDIYEPGSTFKLVTAAAALQEGVVSREERFDVSAGVIQFGRRRIYDTSVHAEPLSFDDVIVKSSNVGAIMVGLRLGPDRLSRYIRGFGFGEALARDLPGQGRGIVHPPSALNSDSEMASVSMGYAVSVTPLQMAAAVNAVASGGDLRQTRLVRAVIRDGVREDVPVHTIRQVVSSETANQLTRIMERVVEEGTGRQAQLSGYRVAGKTGTSAKLIKVAGKKVYSKTDYYASFVGFVPSEQPAMTILVMIDTPRTGPYYGGSVAAPTFRRIAEDALRHLAIPPPVNPAAPLVIDSAATANIAPVQFSSSVQGETNLARTSIPVNGAIPNLVGMSARQATEAVAALWGTVHLVGNGFVTRQEPSAGTVVESGFMARLWMARSHGLAVEVAP